MREIAGLIIGLVLVAIGVGVVAFVGWAVVSSIRQRRAWRPAADDRKSTGPAPAGEPNPHAARPASGATAGMAGAFQAQSQSGQGLDSTLASPGGGMPQEDPYRQGRNR